jgi:uncharacterized repeat protein (TIGR03803 family)
MRHFASTSLVLTAFFLSALTVIVVQPAQAQTYTVLYSFTGGQDGALPSAGVTMDRAGNLYGTAFQGGEYDFGTVFRLTHKGSAWVFSPLYTFIGGNDGADPEAGVIIGPNGSLYGTTAEGGGGNCYSGAGCGTVFDLKPPASACKTALCPWAETVLYSFSEGSDGVQPLSDLVFDQAGNLYGTTSLGGIKQGNCNNNGGCGVVYKLTASNGGWTERVIHSFTGGNDGFTPLSGLVFDQAGNPYGTTRYGGGPGCALLGCGTVYQLTPSGSGWKENVVYKFTGGSDGDDPWGGLIFEQSGDLYCTTVSGGAGGGGTVYELSPSNGGWTLTTLYSFSGSDGSYASLTMDAPGNLYGTTFGDGSYGYGNVFKLTPSNGGWTYTSLHDFTSGCYGYRPRGSVILDTNNNIYGTASQGGIYGYGVVFEITP